MINIVKNRKGGFVFHIGGPLLLIALIVAYIYISLTNPELGNKITGALVALKNATIGK